MSNHPNRNWRSRWPDEAAGFVRSWRTERDLTQATLAKELGVSLRAVEDWEAGRRLPPPYLRIALLALRS